jgi:hypothetical protein
VITASRLTSSADVLSLSLFGASVARFVSTVAELSRASTIAVSVLTGLVTMGGAYLLLGRRLVVTRQSGCV